MGLRDGASSLRLARRGDRGNRGLAHRDPGMSSGFGQGLRRSLRNEPNLRGSRFVWNRLEEGGRVRFGGWAGLLQTFEFVEGVFVGSLSLVDATLETGKGGIRQLEGVAARIRFVVVEEGQLVFPEFRLDGAETAELPLVPDEDIDKAARFRGGGLESLVVFGDEGFEIGGFFQADEERFRVDAGFQGIHFGDSLAFRSTRACRFLRVATVRFDLFESGHKSNQLSAFSYQLADAAFAACPVQPMTVTGERGARAALFAQNVGKTGAILVVRLGTALSGHFTYSGTMFVWSPCVPISTNSPLTPESISVVS